MWTVQPVRAGACHAFLAFFSLRNGSIGNGMSSPLRTDVVEALGWERRRVDERSGRWGIGERPGLPLYVVASRECMYVPVSMLAYWTHHGSGESDVARNVRVQGPIPAYQKRILAPYVLCLSPPLLSFLRICTGSKIPDVYKYAIHSNEFLESFVCLIE